MAKVGTLQRPARQDQVHLRCSVERVKKDQQGRHGNSSQGLICRLLLQLWRRRLASCQKPGHDHSSPERICPPASPQGERRGYGPTASHQRLFTEPARAHFNTLRRRRRHCCGATAGICHMTERLTVPVRRSNYLHP